MAGNVYFDVENVSKQMDILEDMFSLFADELKSINSYIETEVNVGVDSAIFGDYGSKLKQIWDGNASTFGDFHANFESWSEAVAVISSNNDKFVVDTSALYRDTGGTLDGIKGARDYVSNDTMSLSELDKDVLDVLNSANRMKTQKDSTNIYGGKTIEYEDINGNTVKLYYDKNNAYVGKEVIKDGKVKAYDRKSNSINSLPTKDEYYKKNDNENVVSNNLSNNIVSGDGVKNASKHPDFFNVDAYGNGNELTRDGWVGECSWFSVGKFYEMYGYQVKLDNQHRLGRELASEIVRLNDGFTYSTDMPKAGAIFSCPQGPHATQKVGHTGVITAVNGNMVTVQESNVGNFPGAEHYYVNGKPVSYLERTMTIDELKAWYPGINFANPK